MGKKKNGGKKKKTHVQVIPEPEKPKPRLRKIAAYAAAITLAGIVAGATYLNCANRSGEEQKTSVSKYASLRDEWFLRYNERGTDLVPSVMRNYSIFREWDDATRLTQEEYSSIDKKLNETSEKAFNRFVQEPTRENFNSECFFYWFRNGFEHCAYFVPQEVVDIFHITKSHGLLNDLKAYKPKSDQDLVRKMLSFATLLVYQRMEIKEYSGADKLEDLLLHLRQGKGDCSDYTYAIANLYLAACDMLERPELSSRIRTVLGIDVNPERTALHAWIQIQDRTGHWDDIEANHDTLNGNVPFSLDTQALYTFQNGTKNWRVPFITIQQNYDGENKWSPTLRAHVLPAQK